MSSPAWSRWLAALGLVLLAPQVWVMHGAQTLAVPQPQTVTISGSAMLGRATGDYPAYPKDSLTRGVSGVVVFEVVADTEGRTTGGTILLWPGGQPVGQCAYLLRDVRCLTVVGVTRSRRPEQVVTAQFEVFMDIEQAQRLEPNVRRRAVLVSTGNPTAVLPAVNRIATEVAETTGFPPLSARRLSDMADVQTRAIRLATRAFGLFGVLGLLMAGCGIFAVLRFVVSQRVWEIGIRLALGAPRHTVVLAVCGPALRAVCIGALAGVTLAYWGQGLLQSVAIGIAAMDAGTIAIAFAGLALAGLCGALGPAIVAARTNPASALRDFRVL